jgi:co-chaperonin GroES (HSP10)
MTETLERVKHTNPGGYLEIQAEGFTPMGSMILLKWEVARDDLKLGRFLLKRPDTHKAAHYTGVVLAVGPLVSEDVHPGMRIFFEQFSGFEKLFDPEHGRLALIKESAALAVIPERTKIESMDGDYDYDN